MTLPVVNHVAGEFFLYIEGAGLLWFLTVLWRRLRRGEADPARQPVASGTEPGELDLSS